jgi:hypothetical protein
LNGPNVVALASVYDPVSQVSESDDVGFGDVLDWQDFSAVERLQE